MAVGDQSIQKFRASAGPGVAAQAGDLQPKYDDYGVMIGYADPYGNVYSPEQAQQMMAAAQGGGVPGIGSWGTAYKPDGTIDPRAIETLQYNKPIEDAYRQMLGGQATTQRLQDEMSVRAQMVKDATGGASAENKMNVGAVAGRLGEGMNPFMNTILDPGQGEKIITEQGLPAAQGIATSDAANVAAGQAQMQGWNRDVDQLRAAASGNGPSAAQAMLRQQVGATQRNALALAGTARGGNLAGGLRAAMGAGMTANMLSGQQMAAMRAQEQLAAMGQLGQANAMQANAITANRGVDVNKAAQTASAITEAGTARGQLGNQRLIAGMQGHTAQALAGTQMEMAARGHNEALDEQARQRALQAYGVLYSGVQAGENRTAGANQAQQDRNASMINNIVGGALGAGAGMASAGFGG